ncbi:hypothetical protein [Gallaecimonas sp. GXIMD4217]|uniref:hypothetical protein n=1 Tax=Gallaecimonas sp. GXIMD4217 TaxID=3131927 RepID=UPI00311AF860
MSKKPLPEKWQSSVKAAKAVQVAFDLDARLQYAIRRSALEEGLSPSDQIRTLLELPVSRRPKRPRLTVSLSQDDYRLLAERYGLGMDDQLEIKRRCLDELVEKAELIDKEL